MNGSDVKTLFRACVPALVGLFLAVVSALLWWSMEREQGEDPGVLPSGLYGDLVFDFGRSRFGGIVEHRFELKNARGVDLYIDEVIPSCGCTVLEDVPEKIPARSSVFMPISVRLDTVMKRFETSVVVKIRGGDTVALGVQGEVYRTHPLSIDLGELKNLKDFPLRFSLASPNGPLLTVESLAFADALDEKIDFIAYPDERDPHGVLVEAKVDLRENNNKIDRVLRVVTDDEVEPTKEIRVVGYYRGKIKINPDYISVSTSMHRPVDVSVAVAFSGVRSCRLLGVDSVIDGGRVSPKGVGLPVELELENGKAVVLLEYVPSASHAYGLGELVLLFEADTNPVEVRIPFYAGH